VKRGSMYDGYSDVYSLKELQIPQNQLTNISTTCHIDSYILNQIVAWNPTPNRLNGRLGNLLIHALTVLRLHTENEGTQLGILHKHLLKDHLRKLIVVRSLLESVQLLVEEDDVLGGLEVLHDHQFELFLGETVVLVDFFLLVVFEVVHEGVGSEEDYCALQVVADGLFDGGAVF
jgi:hypothetical protein